LEALAEHAMHGLSHYRHANVPLDPELCAKYCPGGLFRSEMQRIVVVNRLWPSYDRGYTLRALAYFDKFKEVSEELKKFSVVVLEALLRFADSPECLSSQDASWREKEALWDCALAEAEELGAMAILFDKMPEGGGLTAPMEVSPELAAIIGMDPSVTSRVQCLKRLWAYLTEHNLQDPEDERFFTPDQKMAKVFGPERMRADKMSEFLGAHLEKIGIEGRHLDKLCAILKKTQL